MSQALKQTIDSSQLDQSAQPVDTTPKFQAYQAQEAEQSVQFKELLFFAQLFSFCVLTVILAFLFLANQVMAILAVPLAISLSACLLLGTRKLLSNFF